MQTYNNREGRYVDIVTLMSEQAPFEMPSLWIIYVIMKNDMTSLKGLRIWICAEEKVCSMESVPGRNRLAEWDFV